MRLSIPISAFVAAIVGFGGTLALIIAAANAVGATHDQTASWVTAICLAMALETAWLSWRTRMPIITAWSTPGAALVAVSSGFTMSDAVGAFIIVALLLILTGVLKPLTRLISRIPASVASGMLAGIVVSFALNAVKTVTVDPVLILPLIAAFFLIRLFNPALSVLAVLIGGGVAAFLLGRVGGLPPPELSTLVLVTPTFSLSADRRSGDPALPRHHGVAEPVRPRRPEGGRLPARAWADHYAVTGVFSLDFGAVWGADDQSRGHIGGDLHRSGRPPRPGRALEDRAVLRARLPDLRHLRRLAGGDLRRVAAEPDRARRRARADGAACQRVVDRAQGRARTHGRDDHLRGDGVRS